MEFLKKYGITWMKALKILGGGILIIIVATVLLSLSDSAIESIGSSKSQNFGFGSSGSSMPGMAMMESASYDMMDEGVALSARNVIVPVPPGDVPVVGSDAEDFEVKEYRGTIETSRLDETCAKVAALKASDEVIFETANEQDTSCHYTFKVVNEKVAGVLAILEELDPKELSEH
ncbi:hypothetical protein ACFLZO_00830, partial [Patescibacteria group bacterium]